MSNTDKPENPQEITAGTMVELKQMLRRAIGWQDRRTWTSREFEVVENKYSISMDHNRNVFVATQKTF